MIDTSSAVQFLVQLLTDVMPIAFLWAFTDRAVKAVIRAATGRAKEGI